MVPKRRIWIGLAMSALACALLVGTAAADRAGASRRTRAADKSRVAKKHKAKKAKRAPAADEKPLAARLHSAWVLYEALADWQLRGDLDPSTYSLARRSVSVALAFASARPGAAVSAALMPEPPLLEQRPVAGAVSSNYGVRRDPFRRKTRKKHNGVDLRAGRGVAVLAAGPGTVAKAERMRGYGRVVYLDHGKGMQTRYAHLQRISVKEGDFVPPGGLVGKVGSSGRATGPHLHFEVRKNGRPVAPVEILGILTSTTPLAWLQELPRRMVEAANPAVAAEQVEAAPPKAKKRAKRGKKRLRSKRPTS
jgi:murein DD-endopeptidase MepM/ murein hydrolase activator NlpD